MHGFTPFKESTGWYRFVMQCHTSLTQCDLVPQELYDIAEYGRNWSVLAGSYDCRTTCSHCCCVFTAFACCTIMCLECKGAELHFCDLVLQGLCMTAQHSRKLEHTCRRPCLHSSLLLNVLLLFTAFAYRAIMCLECKRAEFHFCDLVLQELCMTAQHWSKLEHTCRKPCLHSNLLPSLALPLLWYALLFCNVQCISTRKTHKFVALYKTQTQ